ncbi:synaptotagmin-6-like [Acanthaster planci]|uniref:Synaptotagmin-6-like n=1 Tax=Acanthaster planci TaxID=133434 RepID=A0A8B7ZX10_ACAPL|nr:synaptotagmin-6-like [Acanthaster planci]
MAWDDVPEGIKLLICAVLGAGLMVLILIMLCQCLSRRKKKNGESSEPSDSDDKELADISPHRHLPKEIPSKEKKWAKQSSRSLTSLSSSGSEGYGTLKGLRHQPRKRELKRSLSQTSADLPPLGEIQFLQVPEVIPEPGTLGSISFSLSYDKENENLIVDEISACDLKPRPFGGEPSPYVKVSLLKGGTDKPEFRFQTQVQIKTCNPFFGEAFEATVKSAALLKHTLRLVVCDHHRLGEIDFMGEAQFRLKGVDWKVEIQKELPLEPSTQAPIGELLVSLSYLPTSERLYITILRATGFRNLHGPSIKVSLVLSAKGGQRRRITSSQQRSALVFSEAVFFEIPSDKLERIKILITVLAAKESPPAAADEPDVDEGVPESPDPALREIGKILIGRHCAFNAHAHWEEMILSPRVPIAHWYPIFHDL